MNIGDAVIVKAGVKDPDLGIDISGWQGRVSSMEGTLISIDWDSVTLNQMASDVISMCEKEGWDWRQMNLEASEVEQSVPRDTEEDVASSVARLEKKHAFDHLGEEGKIVRAALGSMESENDVDVHEAWQAYLGEKMSFPFEAKVVEHQESGKLQAGDKVMVQEIEDADDLYGMIVKLKRGSRQSHIPLCDLEAVAKNTRNYWLIKGYASWFFNR